MRNEEAAGGWHQIKRGWLMRKDWSGQEATFEGQDGSLILKGKSSPPEKAVAMELKDSFFPLDLASSLERG